MSQFTMMIPVQGNGASLKAAGESPSETAQTGAEGEGDSLSFTQTLQELSQSNPNAAALLLALQQAGFSPDVSVTLQTGGSTLPPATGADGKLLPIQQAVASAAEATPGITLDSLKALDLRQITPAIAQPLLSLEPTQLRALFQQGDVAQSVDIKGLGDLGGQLQGMGLATNANPVSSAARPMVALPVQVPVGQPGWDNAVGERIQWMVGHNLQQAEIKLTPPHLGPMEIRISLHNDQTSVNFVAAHAATRDALEAAIPRLREMFGGINLNLANVDVSQHQSGGSGQTGQGHGAAASGAYFGDDIATSAIASAPVIHLQSRGVLDTYA
ncbi:MAG: flagellar hook-length control protein FliK [Candidatus Thiodiazotropha sp.]